MCSAGGTIAAKRITGNSIDIRSHGGPISLGQVIGNRVHVSTIALYKQQASEVNKQAEAQDQHLQAASSGRIELQSVYAKELLIRARTSHHPCYRMASSILVAISYVGRLALAPTYACRLLQRCLYNTICAVKHT